MLYCREETQTYKPWGKVLSTRGHCWAEMGAGGGGGGGERLATTTSDQEAEPSIKDLGDKK